MNDNYMKTILSGVKEWTENLTDDAVDKANNALDKANKSIDKALYVVNLTRNSDRTYSADKTFAEITQVYNEGKYSIIAIYSDFVFSLVEVYSGVCHFTSLQASPREVLVFEIQLSSDNKITVGGRILALKTDMLPNPYPLTFTGAVNETYDGSSAKTITIPSGGGSAAWHEIGKQEFDGIESAVEFTCNGEALLVLTIDHTEGLSSVIVTLEHIDGVKNNMYKHTPNSSAFTPKMSFLIFGGTKDRGMISIKGESHEYNGGISNATIEQGYQTVQSPDGAIERVSQSALVKITVTFNAAPKSGAAISLEGI